MPGRDATGRALEVFRLIIGDLVVYAVRAKFRTHAGIRIILLDTGTDDIVENAPGDYYRDCGKDGSGRNRLGEILKAVREEFRNER